MVTVQEIYDFLDKIAPFKTAMDFDNVGLLVGNCNSKVSKALISLDITKEVCDEAKELGAELIISHHPIIFKPIKNLKFDDVITNLIKNNINAICAHTNLDVSAEGVNFQLAQKLSLSDLSPLTYEENQPMGLIGDLPREMSCTECAKFVKKNLSCDGIRYTNTNTKIKKVAVCSGSGGCFINETYEKQADAFVTGEIKHSDILKANHFGVMVVDVGHYKSENVIVEPLKDMLSKQFKQIKFFTSKKFTDKIKYL